MKRLLLILAVFTVSVTFCGCAIKKKSEETEMAKIQNQLNEMQSYKSNITMDRISNKGENTYEAIQYYKATGEYRMDLTSPETVAGNYTIYNGKQVCQYNPRVAGMIVKDVPPSQQRNELFLGQFVKNYMQSEGVGVEAATIGKSNCTVLEAVIPGNDEKLSTEKLWVNNETLLPEKFVLYDNEGNERYIIQYSNFEYNPKLEDTLFVINQ